MEKEHWKNEILGSLEGLQRAEPDPALYAIIQARLKEGVKPRLQVIRRSYVAVAAACLLLLLAANVYALQQQHTKPLRTAPAAYDALENARFDLYQ